MIVESTELVERQDERRILPGRTIHERTNQSGYIVRPGLDTAAGWICIDVGRMFVQANFRWGLDESNLWKRPVLRVGEILGVGQNVLWKLVEDRLPVREILYVAELIEAARTG